MIRISDSAHVLSEEELRGLNRLPVAEIDADDRAFVVGGDVLDGAREAAVQEVEYLGDAGALRGAQFLRQRRHLGFGEPERLFGAQRRGIQRVDVEAQIVAGNRTRNRVTVGGAGCLGGRLAGAAAGGDFVQRSE